MLTGAGAGGVVVGAVTTVLGASITTGGSALSATGGGALVGAPATVAGVAVTGVGATITANATGNIMKAVGGGDSYGTNLQKDLASKEQQSQKGKPIAGQGAKQPIKDIERIIDEHGGSPEDWSKTTSGSRELKDGTKMETHWYENQQTGQRVEEKTKFVK